MSIAFDQIVEVMERLRGVGGCPWDRQQTPESLKPFLLEEAYEVLEAIDSGKTDFLCEELGDLLFQVLFHAEMAKEKGAFDIEAVLQRLVRKMTRRHPHIFASSDPSLAAGMTAEEVIQKWEEMKIRERGKEEKTPSSRRSVLAGVPKTLPALLQAHQVQDKVSRVGFDWKTPQEAFTKIEEELQEVKEALDQGTPDHVEAEWGDLLFSIVNVGRLLKINSEEALRKTIVRFVRRFQKMESTSEADISSLSLEAMNRLWEEAKKEEK